MIVVGSQSILGSYREEDLPTAATMSLEVNILPIADTDEETARLADQIEGVAGEWSLFEEQHGFRIDGVDLTTATLPAGWRDRLVTLSEPQYGPAVRQSTVQRVLPQHGGPLRSEALRFP